MSFEEKYRAELDGIKVPEALTKKTLQMMQNEKSTEPSIKNALDEKKTVDKKSPSKNFKKTLYVLLPTVVAASFLLFMVIPKNQNPILTPLTADQHFTDVELSNGALHFDEIPISDGTVIQIDPNLGVNSESAQSISESELQEQGFLIPQNWNEFSISKKEFKSYFDKKNNQQIYRYAYVLAKDDQTLEVAATNKPGEPIKKNSNIGDVKLNLSYSEEERTYYGEFEKEGVTYKVTGIHVSEEEFINFLLEFLK